MRALVLAAGEAVGSESLASFATLRVSPQMPLLRSLLDQMELAGIGPCHVVVAPGDEDVRSACKLKARVVVDPFALASGPLSSLYLFRDELAARPFVLTRANVFLDSAYLAELATQPTAAIAVDGADATAEFLDKPDVVRFSSVGSRLFFGELVELAARRGFGNGADLSTVLAACSAKQPVMRWRSSVGCIVRLDSLEQVDRLSEPSAGRGTFRNSTVQSSQPANPVLPASLPSPSAA